MTNWKEKQRAATFRGSQFYVDSGERQGGRQTVMHEFPYATKAPFSEDLGIKARKFTVEGYVVGIDYEELKDGLIDALENEGPGELVHPFFGTRRVVVLDYRVRETRADGGMATFSMEFHETSAGNELPHSEIDAVTDVTAKTDTLNLSIVSDFLAKYVTSSIFRDSAVQALAQVNGNVTAILDTHVMLTQQAASLRKRTADMLADAEALADIPQDILDTHLALLEELADALIASDAQPAMTLLSLFDTDFGIRPPDTTPNREVERQNFDAFGHMIQRVVLMHASLAAVGQTFVTYEDALRVRDAITDKIDEHVEATSDDTYPDLMALRASLVGALPGSSSDLPRLQHLTPGAVVPSLVLAHKLYGNLDREEDLIRRNRINNPGFIRGGVELEVLSDAAT